MPGTRNISASPVTKGVFLFRGKYNAHTLQWPFFSKSSEYFPVSQPAMLNFQVDDLDDVLENLSAAGASVDPRREDYD